MSAREVSAAQRQTTFATYVVSAVRGAWATTTRALRGRKHVEDPSPPSGREARVPVSRDESSCCAELTSCYEAAVDARRAELYARLQRQFPLRIAAPR